MTLTEADIQRRLSALEDRVARLEGLPTLAPFRPDLTRPIVTVPERRRTPSVPCTRCGVALSGVSGYACPYQDCPTGLGGAFSQTRID